MCSEYYRWSSVTIISAIWGGRDESKTRHQSTVASRVRRNTGSFRLEHTGRGSQNAITSVSPHNQRLDVMVISPS